MPQRFDFSETVRLIQNTQSGRERNMYAHLKDLFVYVLGHTSENILIDSPQRGRGGNSPDLAIQCDTGITDKKGHALYHNWIVVEVKDERGVFADANEREHIFSDKQKYIYPQTEWFVMVDPECMVIRPIAVRNKITSEEDKIAAKDKIFYWGGDDFDTKDKFSRALSALCFENASTSPALTAFRKGDMLRIAVVQVDVSGEARARLSEAEEECLAQARRDYLNTIRTSTQMLQKACQTALDEWATEIAAIKNSIENFSQQWGGHRLTFDPLFIQGEKIKGSEDKKKHDEQIVLLKKRIRKNPAIAKLAISDLQQNTHLAIESANLILARVLLLRFFEDHGFFGDKKHYVCNGGVAALQSHMKHYQKGYTLVLREAYGKGGEIYNEVFEKTDLDWVLSSSDRTVSCAIELTMMLLSYFDFSTVSGDILNGIYDRFLDREQRKKLGIFYTPPSIVRYIIKRLKIKPGDSVFDPACGSGTFLLEAYEHMAGRDIRNGRSGYQQASDALRGIGGNDINSFSAVMSQIQILWHLLPLKNDLVKNGFPHIRVAVGVDALLQRDGFDQSKPLYKDLDQAVHDFVIGNPPYIRPERSDMEMDRKSDDFYKAIGGAKKNFYDLFLYKALSHWCRKVDENNDNPGRVGFVLPLTFCDSKNSAPLRRCFALGGRFCLREIVNMEIIAGEVFDAGVNPILLIAENRPATAEDKVILRIATEASVIGEGEFDLSRASEGVFNYADVFTEGGQILTKLSEERNKIINKMRGAEHSLADIARTYWVGMSGSSIEKWNINPPQSGALNLSPKQQNSSGTEQLDLHWKEKQMFRRGAVSRGKHKILANGQGLDYYKGENISACLVEGEPAIRNACPQSFDDTSMWRYRDILPATGYAFLQITLGITAVRFNPHDYAFLDTTTLLFPNVEWEQFPLDIALTSNLYQFYYACYLRGGTMQGSGRGHFYPSTLEKTPLPISLLKSADSLHKLRASFLAVCEAITKRKETMAGFLNESSPVILKEICRDKNLAIRWSEGLQNGETVVINAPSIDGAHTQNNRLLLGDEWLEIDDEDIISCLAAVLTIAHGRTLEKKHFQEMLLPLGKADLSAFKKKAREYEAGAYDDQLKKVLMDIDAIVGKAFGLSKQEILYVQQEMEQDGFLRSIRPKMPFVKRRRRGLSSALASSTRYG